MRLMSAVLRSTALTRKQPFHFRCDLCHRSCDAKLAHCVSRFGPGATIDSLLERFSCQCWRHRTDATSRRQKYGMKCTAVVLDLA